MSDDNGPTIELLSPPDMFKGPTYEHAARVGDFIFIAGQVAKDIEGTRDRPQRCRSAGPRGVRKPRQGARPLRRDAR